MRKPHAPTWVPEYKMNWFAKALWAWFIISGLITLVVFLDTLY